MKKHDLQISFPKVVDVCEEMMSASTIILIKETCAEEGQWTHWDMCRGGTVDTLVGEC